MTTPTPAHQAFREKRAAEHCQTSEPYVTADFLAGMRAEHEVARLMGRIELLRQMSDYEYHPVVAKILERTLNADEAQLAALLEGK